MGVDVFCVGCEVEVSGEVSNGSRVLSAGSVFKVQQVEGDPPYGLWLEGRPAGEVWWGAANFRVVATPGVVVDDGVAGLLREDEFAAALAVCWWFDSLCAASRDGLLLGLVDGLAVPVKLLSEGCVVGLYKFLEGVVSDEFLCWRPELLSTIERVCYG